MAAAAQLSTVDVARSQAELNRMKHSLAKWLKYRAMVDQTAQGVLPTSKPVAYAAQIATNAQSKRNEQQLANQIHILLEQVNPDATLPNPDLTANADGAVQLAKQFQRVEIAVHVVQTGNSIPRAMLQPLGYQFAVQRAFGRRDRRRGIGAG